MLMDEKIIGNGIINSQRDTECGSDGSEGQPEDRLLIPSWESRLR